VVFNSLTFLLFFAVVFGLYWLLPGWTARKWLLLVASYIFYGAWSPPYVLLLLASTFLDWWLARRIGRTSDPRKRRFLLVASLTGNLGLLGYFKYGAFLLANFAALLATAGIDYRPVDPGILLPIGISFYTFASLSYTLDVYRGEVR
jgi:alginate O-acetyltransferase complex protein AlgI